MTQERLSKQSITAYLHRRAILKPKRDYMNIQPKKDGSFNYQAIFKHSFTDEDDLMLSFAKKTRFPTIKDRYSFRFGRFIPNPDLKAEEAYHYEVGYSKKFGDDFGLNTAIFYSDIRKKFETIVVQTKPKKLDNFKI